MLTQLIQLTPVRLIKGFKVRSHVGCAKLTLPSWKVHLPEGRNAGPPRCSEKHRFVCGKGDASWDVPMMYCKASDRSSSRSSLSLSLSFSLCQNLRGNPMEPSDEWVFPIALSENGRLLIVTLIPQFHSGTGYDRYIYILCTTELGLVK